MTVSEYVAPAAEALCRHKHPLEWREDGRGRHNPCTECTAAAVVVAKALGFQIPNGAQ